MDSSTQGQSFSENVLLFFFKGTLVWLSRAEHAKGLGNNAVLSAGWQVSEMRHDSEMEQDRQDMILRQEVILR